MVTLLEYDTEGCTGLGEHSVCEIGPVREGELPLCEYAERNLCICYGECWAHGPHEACDEISPKYCYHGMCNGCCPS